MTFEMTENAWWLVVLVGVAVVIVLPLLRMMVDRWWF